MKKMCLVMTALLLVIALPILAPAQQLFDYNGQARVPTEVGGTLEMYSRLFDPFPALTPLPLDFDTNEYTLVITDLTLDAIGYQQNYVDGYIAIYQDTATVADYGLTATFTDGVIILDGVVTYFNRSMYTSTLGAGAGRVNWTGGLMIDDIAPTDQLNWPLVTAISRLVSFVMPGYDENWDGKVEPEEIIIPNTRTTWGQVKSLF